MWWKITERVRQARQYVRDLKEYERNFGSDTSKVESGAFGALTGVLLGVLLKVAPDWIHWILWTH